MQDKDRVIKQIKEVQKAYAKLNVYMSKLDNIHAQEKVEELRGATILLDEWIENIKEIK